MLAKILCTIAKALGGCQAATLDDYIRYVRSHFGKIPRYEVSFDELKAELADMGLRCMTDMPDYKKHYTDLDTLREIIPWLTYRADYYISELEINCDDYALWAAADARQIFNIQGVWQCWGDTPLGYHAWNIAKTPGAWVQFESNAGFPFAGEPFAIGENGYIPKVWK